MVIYAPGFGAGMSFFGSASFSNLAFFSSFLRTLPAIKRTLASSMILGLTSFFFGDAFGFERNVEIR